MVEVSGRGPQLGRILDTNRVPDIFFGPESRKSPDLTEVQNVENFQNNMKNKNLQNCPKIIPTHLLRILRAW